MSSVESVTAVEWQVLAAMGEETTVAQIIGSSGLSAFTVFDVLHRLLRRGLVVAQGDAPAPSAKNTWQCLSAGALGFSLPPLGNS